MSVTDAQCIVIKVGTSTLTYENGKLNIRRIAKLTSVIADLCNSGRQVVLVTSGAIAVGVGKLGLGSRPSETSSRQALSTVGQCELMSVYDRFFLENGYNIGQMLITKEDVDDKTRKTNLINTFSKMFDYGVIPVINENDCVAVDEVVYGDNDTLSAVVAKLVGADLLIILTDAQGLYDKDPSASKDAKLIPVVKNITPEHVNAAGGAGSKRGTGGMVTKLHAAQIATDAGIDTVVMNGEYPQKIYKLLDGASIGTLFEKHGE